MAVYFGVGCEFSMEEHDMIRQWNMSREKLWPELKMATNYPMTPEMLGIIEVGWETPTFFVWKTDSNIIVSPFSGDYIVKFDGMKEFLESLVVWARANLLGRCPIFENNGRNSQQ